MDIKQDIHIWQGRCQKDDQVRCADLAARFQFTLSSDCTSGARYLLSFTNDILELRINSAAGLLGPLRVDFLSAQNLYRLRTDMRLDQPLAKADGLKRGKRPVVCDATAGFGKDGFILAAYGCPVHLVERSFLIWLLLEDGIRRTASHKKTAPIAERISLIHADARNYLKTSEIHFDTIYLDPMYPQRKKSALNKKELRNIKEVVGTDDDASCLLDTARLVARNRSVVKRPLGAAALAENADFTITGKSTRYDVYLAQPGPRCAP